MPVEPRPVEVAVEWTVNGRPVSVTVRPNELAIDVLRDRLGLTGVKRSCDVEICGVCTILVDGRAVSACITLALELDGCEVLTVEGLESEDGTLHPLQQAFIDHEALQCGFCTPGFLMTAYQLLADGVRDRAELRRGLDANICRCTGYVTIERAVMDAAAHLDSSASGGTSATAAG